jgi:ABC-type dipeptide/oligopeptide/nickel transport system permease component
MENRTLFVVYLAVWLPYVAGLHAYGWWRRLGQGGVALSHAMPSLVAMTMAYIFLIGHGATVRQFVAGSERGMDLWSLWVGLWPLLLLTTFGAGVAQALWMIVVSVKREWRPWIPVPLTGTAMCAFSFLTVMTNFPDA